MKTSRFLLPDDHPADHSQVSLNQILIDSGAVAPRDMFRAVTIQQTQNTQLEWILLANGWVAPEALLKAQAQYLGLDIIDPLFMPPELLLIDTAGTAFCLSHSILPWRHIDGEVWVAVSEIGCSAQLKDKLSLIFGTTHLVLCSKANIEQAILRLRGPSLVHRAESCVPADKSCRSHGRNNFVWLGFLILVMIAVLIWQPPLVILAIILLGVFIGLLLQTILKLVCFVTALHMRRKNTPLPNQSEMPLPASLPVISVLIALYKESDITDHLVSRLMQLEYPRELTDVILVLEADDKVTHRAIEQANLPNWFRVVEVPEGSIKTKPRALNYGLSFCRGDIIGVWDAEDKPLPDQLYQIARHFHVAAPKTGCVQGVLDYYNPRTNWISRCFTIEYASWFRVLLPAMARLGLTIPLGGTTCFFRREALQDVCAWDAWNVTEDADLGIRLARHGWDIEIVPTTTDEEANCRPLPWVKQRSRWLKGYAMTWSVHMRKPFKLRRELGTIRFIGFQIQFLTLIGQVLFAPAIWGFWLLSAGLSYPLSDQFHDMFGTISITLMCSLFVASEVLNVIIGLYAVSGRKHRHLRKWVVTTPLYFPLGYFALCKAGYELFTRPFYWDKTAHGIFEETPEIEGLEDDLVQVPLIGAIGD